jgi:peptidoglycan/LPS O-acetylase OafA/YrhL
VTHRLEHRIEWLDGLRGIAVLMVVWYHAYLVGQWVPDIPAFGHYYNFEEMPGTGFIGVELFFFISGFVLFYPYARNLFEGRPLDDLPTFGWRRFIKIVPSYVFILLVLVLFGGIAMHSASELAWIVAVHLGFVLNLLPVHPFGQINAVLWSLSVEVQFYLVFPLIARVFKRYPFATWLAACLIACAYRLITIPYVDKYPALLPQLPAYIDLFAAGMFAAYWCVRLRVQFKPAPWVTYAATLSALLGVFLTVVMLGALWASRMHPDWRENWSILGRFGLSLTFIAIALGSTFGASWWRKALGNPVLVFFSIISYNVYLWHHFIFVMMSRSLAAIMAPLPLTLAITLGGFGFGAFFTYFLERPLLRLDPPWKRDRPEPALVPVPVEVPGPGA